MKAGVILERWKLPIFKRRLEAAGWTFEQFPGLTPDLATLQVLYTDQPDRDALQVVLAAAMAEAKSTGKPNQ